MQAFVTTGVNAALGVGDMTAAAFLTGANFIAAALGAGAMTAAAFLTGANFKAAALGTGAFLVEVGLP